MDVQETIRVLDQVFLMTHGSARVDLSGMLRAFGEVWIRRGALLIRGAAAFHQLYIVCPWDAKITIRRYKDATVGTCWCGPRARVYPQPRAANHQPSRLAWGALEREARAMLVEATAAVHEENLGWFTDQQEPHDRMMQALNGWGRHPHKTGPLDIQDLRPQGESDARNQTKPDASG